MVERTSRDSIPKPMVLTSIGSVLSADDGQHYGSTEKALGGATYADFGLSEPMYPENILSPFSGCEVFATGVDVVSDIAPKRLVRCKLHYSLNYGEFEVWTDTANVAEADKLRSKVDYEQSALAALENQEWVRYADYCAKNKKDEQCQISTIPLFIKQARTVRITL